MKVYNVRVRSTAKKITHKTNARRFIKDATRCIGCGRWIYEPSYSPAIDKKTGKEYHFYYEVNYDKAQKCYYISNRTHRPINCLKGKNK